MEINEVLQGTENALIIVRRNDLLDFAETYAKKVMAEQPKEPATDEPEAPISQNEAIKFLGKSRQCFYKWRKKGIVKAHILGGRVHYFKSELLAAMR